jgi:hypothetical protein
MAGPLAGHDIVGNVAKLGVDNGRQLLERHFVAASPGLQQDV